MTYYKCGRVYTTQNSNVVVDTASGAIANFNTPLALPLLETKFDVNAKQEAGTPTPQSPKAISGVSAVNVIHCGANLLDLSALIDNNYYSLNNDGSLKVLQTDNRGWAYVPVCGWLKAGTYKYVRSVTSGTCDLRFSKNNYSTSNVLSGTNLSKTFTLTEDSYFKIKLGYGLTSENYPFDCFYSINYGSDALPFEQYNGSTTLINLGGTYYGGYVSQDKNGKRELVVTHGIKLFSELEFRRSNSSGSWSSYVFFAQISDKTNKSVVKCSNYAYVTQSIASMQNETITSGSLNEYIYIRDDTYTDVQTFKTANANTQLWYELAEPFTVALPDGEPIKSFAGINNIYADTGDTSLQFRKIG